MTRRAFSAKKGLPVSASLLPNLNVDAYVPDLLFSVKTLNSFSIPPSYSWPYCKRAIKQICTKCVINISQRDKLLPSS